MSKVILLMPAFAAARTKEVGLHELAKMIWEELTLPRERIAGVGGIFSRGQRREHPGRRAGSVECRSADVQVREGEGGKERDAHSGGWSDGAGTWRMPFTLATHSGLVRSRYSTLR